jgi:hypothetical protein
MAEAVGFEAKITIFCDFLAQFIVQHRANSSLTPVQHLSCTLTDSLTETEFHFGTACRVTSLRLPFHFLSLASSGSELTPPWAVASVRHYENESNKLRMFHIWFDRADAPGIKAFFNLKIIVSFLPAAAINR